MANPLTEADRTQIDEAMAQLKEARDQIARAKSAGIDVADMEADVARLTDQLSRIKAAYFPTGRKA